MSSVPSITVAIPTLDRGPVLRSTLEALICHESNFEILVIDQTASHPKCVEDYLRKENEIGTIRWIHQEAPSIPKAMNWALRQATGDIVLFLDDDILPGENLVARHFRNYNDPSITAVVGQVIQPWQTPCDLPRPTQRSGIRADLDFPFHSMRRAVVSNVMAGNLSLRRDAALACGGFDENFIGAAYRFETEFCRRLVRHGGKVVFDPEASVRHLKAETGGTKIFGDGVRGSQIEHSVGAYYFAYLESSGIERIGFVLQTLWVTTCSKFHATHPWLIPGHIHCQIASLRLARRLYSGKRSVASAA